MQEQSYELYCHTNTVNGKKYVGITMRGAEKRWGANGSRYKGQALGYAIEKYGWDAFEHEVLLTGLTKKQAEEEERRLIEELGTMVPNGYNLTSGGNLGAVLSDESREKLRSVHLGKPKKPEAIAKTAAAHQGKVVSDETRKKLSEARKGLKESEEWRRHISEGCKGKKWTESQRQKVKETRVYPKGAEVKTAKRVAQYTKDGTLVRTFGCIRDAEKSIGNGHHIAECCKGKVGSAGGFVWRYIDD